MSNTTTRLALSANLKRLEAESIGILREVAAEFRNPVMLYSIGKDSRADTRPEVVDQFAAHVLWMTEDAMLPGRSYLMRIGTKYLPARITSLKHKVDVNTLDHIAAKTLGLNEIGLCNLSTAAPVIARACWSIRPREWRSTVTGRPFSGLPVCRGPGRVRSRTLRRASCTCSAPTPICSTATTCVTA
jgi:hypothetical protein